MIRGAVLLAFLLVPRLAAQESGVDTQVFRWINHGQNPERNGFFEYLDLSSLPTFAAVPIGFLVVGAIAENPSTAFVGSMSAVGQITAFGITTALKETFSRPRPFETLPDVLVKHRWSAHGNSFPSGHASQAFSIATVIALKYERASMTIPLFLWATSVGIGRIYLGLHYPSDVVGGMIVGIASGFVAWSLRAVIQKFSTRIAGGHEILQFPIPDVTLLVVRIPYK